MKVRLIQIGKTNEAYLTEGIQHYEKRLRGLCEFSVLTLADVKNAASLKAEQLKEKEGELILKSLQANERVVLLDEKGKRPTSEAFAEMLNKWAVGGTSQLCFVIGGAFGTSDAVKSRADFTLALSEMTFSHQLVRLVFVEQLYRGYSILNNLPYHHR